nr:MAG TPA: hypothetical protein [Caudoviricetes sp.]
MVFSQKMCNYKNILYGSHHGLQTLIYRHLSCLQKYSK